MVQCPQKIKSSERSGSMSHKMDGENSVNRDVQVREEKREEKREERREKRKETKE